MKFRHVRAIAICIIRHKDSILVFEGRDESKEEIFYRPLGGAIEFGEYSNDTVQREIREEIGAEIVNLRFVGILENVFQYEGKPGHEIVIIYEADFVDESFYLKAELYGKTDDGNELKVVWKSIQDFSNENAPLYPEGLLQILKKPTNVST